MTETGIETIFSLSKIKALCFDPFTNASCLYELDGKPLTRLEIEEVIKAGKTRPRPPSSCMPMCPSSQEEIDKQRAQCIAEIAYLVNHWSSFKTWVVPYKTVYHRKLSFDSMAAERYLSAAIYMDETTIKGKYKNFYPPCEDTIAYFQ